MFDYDLVVIDSSLEFGDFALFVGDGEGIDGSKCYGGFSWAGNDVDFQMSVMFATVDQLGSPPEFG